MGPEPYLLGSCDDTIRQVKPCVKLFSQVHKLLDSLTLMSSRPGQEGLHYSAVFILAQQNQAERDGVNICNVSREEGGSVSSEWKSLTTSAIILCPAAKW